MHYVIPMAFKLTLIYYYICKKSVCKQMPLVALFL